MTIDADWRIEYPFTSHRVGMEGGNYHYLDEGRGSPLLMVHGNPTWSFYWRHLVLGLRDEYRVVVPDHMGCGLSDKPHPYPYCLQRHSDNLVRLIDTLDLRDITLLAHDWGGPIGLAAALARPDRFSRFVLFNTGAFPPPFIPLRIRVCKTPLLGRIAVQGMNLFSAAAVRMAVEHPRSLSKVARAGLLAPYDSWGAREAVFRFVQDIPTSRRQPTWQLLESIEQGLASFQTRPFLMVWGMRDWCFTPACLDRLVELVPSANVVRIEDAGHWVVEEAPERILQELKPFLAVGAAS